MPQLTNAERQYLRRLAHDLRPAAQIGKQGLTPSVQANIERELDAHELIKIKFQDFQDQKHELSEEIAGEARATLVSVIGNVAVLYREQPDPDRRRIKLPR